MRLSRILFTPGLLLAIAATLLAFGLNYNASKSNTGNFVLAYSPDRLTAAQAAAVLNDMEKSGKTPDEAFVRVVLQKQGGMKGAALQKIVITERTGTGGKGYTILLLEKPEDEATARAAGERLSPGSMKK